MTTQKAYDVAIVGGGLAGLAAAILLGKEGYSVALFEKETYPFHKVCGEYISLESWPFLEQLGVPLKALDLPLIDTLFLTAPNGNSFTTKLPQGGFGISRYTLDHLLAGLAKASGVSLFEATKVEKIEAAAEGFQLTTNKGIYQSNICCAAWGKRSNLDARWNRSFLRRQNNRLNNYIGIKYHIKIKRASNFIGLHNFKDGYCGISKIDGDCHCLCYITKAANLKKSDNNIGLMEKNILGGNPFLQEIFSECVVIQSFPITISQISFSSKSSIENGVLMLGDTGGMITPLCGNGMSIALHTAKIAAALIADFLAHKISKTELELAYTKQWKKQFAARLATGRAIQYFFGSKVMSNLFVSLFKKAPFLAKPLIKQTHGKPF